MIISRFNFFKKQIFFLNSNLCFHMQFPYAVWSVRAFPHMNKEETFFFLENCTLLWSETFLSFLITFLLVIFFNYFFIRPESLKISLKIFWEKRYRLLLCPNHTHTFWFLITLCNMAKGKGTQLQDKLHQHLCIHLLY